MNHDSAFDDVSIPVLTEVVHETPFMPAPAATDAAVAEVVLTEVIALPPQAAIEAETSRPREGGDPISRAEAAPKDAPAAQPAPTAQASLEERAAAQLTTEEWDELELRLSERILRQLQGRVEFVLHQRVRDSMTEVLQHAMSDLADELRTGLEQTIEQIVSRAVSQELAHLKTLQH
jgi:hypothetical protein